MKFNRRVHRSCAISVTSNITMYKLYDHTRYTIGRSEMRICSELSVLYPCTDSRLPAPCAKF